MQDTSCLFLSLNISIEVLKWNMFYEKYFEKNQHVNGLASLISNNCVWNNHTKLLLRRIWWETFCNILFCNNRLKFYNILSVLLILIIFIIYQTRRSFPKKFNPVPTKFCFLNNSEHNNISSVIFHVYFDLQCSNVASNNSTRSILIITKINRNH